MKGPLDKICGACGEAFVCGLYGCWCGQIAVTDRQMAWIEKSFQDCLCPICLKKVAGGELGPAPVAGPQ